VHVLGGIRPDGISPDLAFATYTANLAWAAEQAAGLPVTLVLEAINRRDVPGFVLGSLEQAAAVVHAVGSERVRLLFDIYHCQVGQGDVTTRLETLLPLVAHVQVADAPRRTEPGTGELAWDFVFGTLRRLGYPGWIGCEYQPVAGTVDGLGWRERFGF
jgi:hydroxypyruvate isomerase